MVLQSADKTAGSAGLIRAPRHFTPTGPIASIISRTFPPLDMWIVDVYQTWSGSVAICRSYSRKIDFSDPRVFTMPLNSNH